MLVAAFRANHSHRSTARTWLSQARHDCAQERETLALLPMVVTSVLRLVTSPRVFADPGKVEGAIAFMDVVRESPGVELKACADKWPRLRNMLLTLGQQGDLVTDAWIAATVQVFFEHLVTFDRNFTRLMPGRDLTLLS